MVFITSIAATTFRRWRSRHRTGRNTRIRGGAAAARQPDFMDRGHSAGLLADLWTWRAARNLSAATRSHKQPGVGVILASIRRCTAAWANYSRSTRCHFMWKVLLEASKPRPCRSLRIKSRYPFMRKVPSAKAQSRHLSRCSCMRKVPFGLALNHLRNNGFSQHPPSRKRRRRICHYALARVLPARNTVSRRCWGR